MRTVIYRQAAELELQEAYHWYEGCQTGLGSDFMRCIEGCVELIRRYPEIFPSAHGIVRHGVIRRFPYSLFYVPSEESIIIIAVFHSSRKPMRWKRRSPLT